jgi:hypothetical protein
MLCEIPAVLNVWPDNETYEDSICSQQAVLDEFASWFETKLLRYTWQLFFS